MTTADELKKPKTWRQKLVMSLAAAVLAIFIGWPLMWQLGFGLPGPAEFFLHQARYEQIVAAVKKLGTKQSTGGAVANGYDRDINGFHVSWSRDVGGNYKITIMTVDWDHGGSWGYVFADVPLAQAADGEYRDYDVPGGLPLVDKRINKHWWSVYTNLN